MLPQRAPDGQVFYHRNGRVWSVSEKGGEATVVLDTPVHWSQWCVWNRNLVFVRSEAEAGPSIEMMDLTTGETTELVSLGPGARLSFGLNVSPDGRWILCTRLDSSGADLMLVENLR